MKLVNRLIKHKVLFILLILCFIAIFLLSICLVIYVYDNDRNIRQVTLVYSYSKNSSTLTVDNSMPITDSIGKQLTFSANQEKYGYSEFSVFANMDGMEAIDYEIYVVPVGVALELPKDYVKFYLTREENDLPLDGYQKNVPTYSALKVAKANPAGKRIYFGTLKKGEVANFKLRMWLADTYPITMEKRNFKVSIYVKVID